MRRIAVVVLVAACALTACAEADSDMDAARVEPALSQEVEIEAIAFDPAVLEASVGETITWTNRDEAVKHTVTSGEPGDKGVPGLDEAKPDKPDGIFDGRLADAGDTFEFTFDEPGTFDYFCRVHPVMTARITITG